MNLRFATDILKRLGEELNESFDRGVLELVKNAYDADATECVVELDGVNREGGTVRVHDDGDGMTHRQIETGWLVVGHSVKTPSRRTQLGRYPACNTGLGRLAALRMGQRALLRTRPQVPSERGNEYSVELDWEVYDNAALVEQVEVEIAPTDLDPGTTVEIVELRSRLGRMDMKRLARGLILLSDPFDDDPSGFQPELKAPAYRDLEQLVRRRYLGEASYYMRAALDADGQASAVVTDGKREVLFEAERADLRRPGDGPYDREPMGVEEPPHDLASEVQIVKRAARQAGLAPAVYSGHSLRAGFATRAARAGAHERAIMKRTRHKSEKVLREYIRDGRLFDENPTDSPGL